MSTPARIFAFIAVLVVLFGAAFGVGKLFDDEPSAYRLTATYQPGLLSLDIVEGDDRVLEYEVRHEKELHLIAVRQDFGDYRHLHPQFAGSGGWIVPDLALSPGVWRLYADFQAKGGEPTVAQDDVTVPGGVEPVPPAPVKRTVAVDGYQVSMAGDGSMLTFRVSRRDALIKLQPYLGAYGHLVVVRESDLKYLHVHPESSTPTEPIPFAVEIPDAGRYHLYLDFKTAGQVRTAHFVLVAKGVAHHGDH